MNFIFCALLMCFMVSCVRPKNENNIKFNMDSEELKILQSHCDEINTHGDILVLLKEIKNEVREILRLLEDPPKGARFQITQLAASIDKKTQSVRALSKSDWTTERWDHEIIWLIDHKDFNHKFGNFSLDQVDVEEIYFMGEKRNDIFDKLAIEKNENLASVKYRSRGSSLEICQLERTLILVLGVYTSSLKIKRHQFFSLTVSNQKENL